MMNTNTNANMIDVIEETGRINIEALTKVKALKTELNYLESDVKFLTDMSTTLMETKIKPNYERFLNDKKLVDERQYVIEEAQYITNIKDYNNYIERKIKAEKRISEIKSELSKYRY